MPRPIVAVTTEPLPNGKRYHLWTYVKRRRTVFKSIDVVNGDRQELEAEITAHDQARKAPKGL